MHRFPLVALAAIALVLVFSSSPVAAQGNAGASSRIGFWQNVGDFTPTTGVGTLDDDGQASGTITCHNTANSGSGYGVIYYAGAAGMSDIGSGGNTGDYSGSVWAKLYNGTSSPIDLQGYFYIYTYGGAGDGGAASVFSNASMSNASSSGYATVNSSDLANDPSTWKDYLDDDYFSIDMPSVAGSYGSAAYIAPGKFKWWSGAINGNAFAAQ